jgi:hypothetical protein
MMTMTHLGPPFGTLDDSRRHTWTLGKQTS